jgi:hypothetical protein
MDLNVTHTISLDGVVGDTRQHGEPRFGTQTEPLCHPWEEMGQTVMSTLDTLGNTSTSRSE